MPHIPKFKHAWVTWIAVLVLLPVIQAALSGCSGNHGHYGNIRPSHEVSEIFKDYEVLPDHHYYFSGPEAQPFYIIGIEKSYFLQSEFWKPVDLTPRQIDHWLNFLGQSALYRMHPYGATIIGPAEEQIGVWYSVLDWRSRGTVRLAEERQVFVTIPPRRLDHFNDTDGRDRPFPWIIAP